LIFNKLRILKKESSSIKRQLTIWFHYSLAQLIALTNLNQNWALFQKYQPDLSEATKNVNIALWDKTTIAESVSK
jgi:hypothetical protein